MQESNGRQELLWLSDVSSISLLTLELSSQSSQLPKNNLDSKIAAVLPRLCNYFCQGWDAQVCNYFCQGWDAQGCNWHASVQWQTRAALTQSSIFYQSPDSQAFFSKVLLIPRLLQYCPGYSITSSWIPRYMFTAIRAVCLIIASKEDNLKWQIPWVERMQCTDTIDDFIKV